MPLRALVDGRELQVWDLTGEAWQELKRRSRTAEAAIRMACCGAPAVAKTSRMSTAERFRSAGRSKFPSLEASSAAVRAPLAWAAQVGS